MSGAESWQRWTRTRRRSPTRVLFKVEVNADMQGPQVNETKRREDGALLGRGEKDDADLWLLGRTEMACWAAGVETRREAGLGQREGDRDGPPAKAEWGAGSGPHGAERS